MLLITETAALDGKRTITTGPSAISETAWGAVLKKDRNYDGKFVYAAVTTGIYCRPSCPARNPLRRNTLIFWKAEEAERQGYIACRRCYPNSLTPVEESIRALLDYTEAHLEQAITLRTLSQVWRFSPHHLPPRELQEDRRGCRQGILRPATNRAVQTTYPGRTLH